MYIENEKKLTTKYRDKFRKEWNMFIEEYANKNTNKKLLYIYSKDSQIEDMYNARICEEGKSHEVIHIKKEELPEEADINTAIRLYDDQCVIDEEATKEISDHHEEIINRIICEQEKELDERRIEGHIYLVDEVEIDRVCLYDISIDDSDGVEVMEEITIPEEIRLKINNGSKLIYKEGKYELY